MEYYQPVAPDQSGIDLPSPLKVINEAQQNPDLKHIYTNGFAVGITNADVALVLQLSGRSIEVVHMSYTLAKTLAQRLGRVVSELESKILTTLVTTDMIDEFFKADKKDDK
jgi:hypothetical protein